MLLKHISGKLASASLATNYHVLGKFWTLSAQIIDESSARISGADLWQLMPAFLATNDYALGKFEKLYAEIIQDSNPHIPKSQTTAALNIVGLPINMGPPHPSSTSLSLPLSHRILDLGKNTCLGGQFRDTCQRFSAQFLDHWRQHFPGSRSSQLGDHGA